MDGLLTAKIFLQPILAFFFLFWEFGQVLVGVLVVEIIFYLFFSEKEWSFTLAFQKHKNHEIPFLDVPQVKLLCIINPKNQFLAFSLHNFFCSSYVATNILKCFGAMAIKFNYYTIRLNFP